MIIKNKINDQVKIEEIYNLCNDCNFPYYWNENQIYPNNPMKQYGGFTHNLYKENNIYSNVFNIFYDLIQEIFKKEQIYIKSLFRLQVNLSTNIKLTKKELINSVHQDRVLPNYKSLIYYVGDSDGDTIIYNEDKSILDAIQPIKGNYVIFNSNTFHRASIPKIHKKRMVINCIVEV
jgi:hypothetical protein